jgi:hypothetical protein
VTRPTTQAEHRVGSSSFQGGKRITLDAYYQRDTLDELAATTTVPEAQVILYDDVVVATERIGCVVE